MRRLASLALIAALPRGGVLAAPAVSCERTPSDAALLDLWSAARADAGLAARAPPPPSDGAAGWRDSQLAFMRAFHSFTPRTTLSVGTARRCVVYVPVFKASLSL